MTRKKNTERSLFRKILNGIIMFFLGIFLILLLLFTFTQTSTFRNYARAKINGYVNDAIVGRFNVESISGSIFTSLTLRNVSLIDSRDTVFACNKIEVVAAPLELLLGKIYFRSVIISNSNIKIRTDKYGQMNFAEIFSKDSGEISSIEKPDTSESSKEESSKFPFTIQVNNLELLDNSFSIKTEDYFHADSLYRTANFSDLSIEDLSLNASALIDIAENDYQLRINYLYFDTNLKTFKLRNLSGYFRVREDYASASNLKMLTDSTELNLSARLDGLNLFNTVSLEKFENFPIEIQLDAKRFNFDDLTSFIGSTEILKGDPSITLSCDGTFGSLNINKLIVDLENSHLDFKGNISKLNTPKNLFIEGEFNNSDVDYDDAYALLEPLNLPKFAGLKVDSLGIIYSGEPTNFNAQLSGKINEGLISADCSLDLGVDPVKYHALFETVNLDLAPIINTHSNLTSHGKIKGTSFEPEKMNSNFSIFLKNSNIDILNIDSLNLDAAAKAKIIDLDLISSVNKTSAAVRGVLNLKNSRAPIYDLEGTLKGLNFAEFVEDTSLVSSLNFYFSAAGKNLDIDTLTGRFYAKLNPSQFKNVSLKESELQLTVDRDDNYRKIDLSSDFVDFMIDGNFSLKKAIDLLSYQSEVTSKIFIEKSTELNPIDVIEKPAENKAYSLTLPDFVSDSLLFNFQYQFKDFDLISTLLEFDKLSLSGSGKGQVINDSTNFTVKATTGIDYFFDVTQNDIFYLSDAEIDLNFSRDNRSTDFDNLFGTVTIDGNRLYAGEEFTNLYAGIVFNQKEFVFDISASVGNNLEIETDGTLKMSSADNFFTINRLWVNYKYLPWANKNPLKIDVSENEITISDFELFHNKASVSAEGVLRNNKDQLFTAELHEIPGKLLMDYLSPKRSSLDAKINSKVVLTGTLSDPIIDFKLNADSISYGNITFGDLAGEVRYSDQMIHPDFSFVNSIKKEEKQLFSFNGYFPLNLSLTAQNAPAIQKKEMDLSFKSHGFNIKSAGNLLPFIHEQTGLLDADLHLIGTIDKPEIRGYITLNNCDFILSTNNLRYNMGMKTRFSGDLISLDSLRIKNKRDYNFPRQLYGRGLAELDGFGLKNADLKLNGGLVLMTEDSKAVSPTVFGNLFLHTDGDWRLTYTQGKTKLTGSMVLDKADLIFTSGQGVYNSSNDIVYNILTDSTNLNQHEALFRGILSSIDNKGNDTDTKDINLDYHIKLSMGEESSLTFLLSQLWNQKLVVVPSGSIIFKNEGGISSTQGSLTMLEGSKFEYFKTLQATGNVLFENDLTNPYINIIATYRGDWLDQQNVVQDVEVRITLKGLLQILGEKLASDPKNFAIYIGQRNIADNIKSTQYDDSDAISFIFVGKFKDELSSADKKELATETAFNQTATVFLGTVLSSFLNSTLGDVVGNVSLNRAGVNTLFKVSGKIENVRYTIGGTQEVFQDISKADIKVEYIFSPSFLIRLERKNPVITSSTLSQKISEIGLRYRFQF